jgi:hypothetical protein
VFASYLVGLHAQAAAWNLHGSEPMPRWLTGILLLCSLSHAGLSQAGPARVLRSRGPVHRQVASQNFDWDDNVIVMLTRAFLRSKSGGPEAPVSTADFAIHKHDIGKTGPYANYEIDPMPGTGTFRHFGENGRDNFFMRDLEATLAQATGWKGPKWDAFVEALATEQGARRTTIITAREHDPRSVHKGLVHLQRLGMIRYVPPVENIFTVGVGRTDFQLNGKEVTGTNADRKVAVQKYLLDELAKKPLGRRSVSLVDRDGSGRARLHVWTFSDDDHENYRAAVDRLAKEVAAGKWPNVKIKVQFTGLNDPRHGPETLVIKADGTTRMERADEMNEHLSIWGPRS